MVDSIEERGHTEAHEVLADLATRTRLREGPMGIEAVLRAIQRAGEINGRDLSRQTRLPVPVITAIRREMERAGLVEPGPAISLSVQGARFVEVELGLMGRDFTCRTCRGSRVAPGPGWSDVLARLYQEFERNPTVDVTLDQSHCTPETNLRRVLYMQTQGALAGKSVLLLGDDDSVSLAIGLVGRELSQQRGPLARRITVVDTDTRILDHLREVAATEGFAIETIEHNLREPLPASLVGQFDTIMTDPPYTIPGLRLFLSRAVEAARPASGRQIFLSFGHRPPSEQVEFMSTIAASGLALNELTPGFNEYRGASILGGVSQMALLGTTDETVPLLTGEFAGALYTGEVRPTVRTYRCLQCGTMLRVGQTAGAAATTIEALKAQGCPNCGSHQFSLESREAADQLADGGAAL